MTGRDNPETIQVSPATLYREAADGSEKVRSADRRLSEDKGDCISKRPSIIAVREPQVQ